MPRSLWKGAISFGLVNVPVELHSAHGRSSELDLTMLERRDMALRLVEDMSDAWKPQSYRDSYREDLRKRVEESIAKKPARKRHRRAA